MKSDHSDKTLNLEFLSSHQIISVVLVVTRRAVDGLVSYTLLYYMS